MTEPQEHELLVLARKLRYDLTGMQVKVSELIRALAALDLPEPSQGECEKCHTLFSGKLSLAEHIYLSHDGPEPEHWKEAERLAAQEAD